MATNIRTEGTTPSRFGRAGLKPAPTCTRCDASFTDPLSITFVTIQGGQDFIIALDSRLRRNDSGHQLFGNKSLQWVVIA